jgi:hypothetical protein
MSTLATKYSCYVTKTYTRRVWWGIFSRISCFNSVTWPSLLRKGVIRERGEPACKPGSVEGNHSSTDYVTAALQRPTRKHAGPTLPGSCDPGYFPIWSCSRRGLPCRRVLPPTRCALTAPFHPYQHPGRISPARALRRSALCCTFRGLAPPRGYLAPCPLEPGLSSPPCPCGPGAAIARPTPRANNSSPRTAAPISTSARRLRPSRAAASASQWQAAP